MASLVLVATAASENPASALTILDSFDTGSASITASGSAYATYGGLQTGTTSSQITQIESAIQQTTNSIAALYSNNVTVNLLFTFDSGVLGQSLNNFYGVSYGGYTQALNTDATSHAANTVLNTAVQNLSKGNSATNQNGVANTSIGNVVGTTTLFKTLGLLSPTTAGAFSDGSGTNFDAVITLNSGTDGMYWGAGASPGLYSGVAVTEHEVTEVLGGGGAGSTLGSVLAMQQSQPYSPFFTSAYGALDLYRYSAPGVGSFTTSSSAASYFSVNGGATSIASFNQSGSGDFADLATNTPCPNQPSQIQDAFACPGATYGAFDASTSNTMLQAIGYDLQSAPGPTPGAGSFGFLIASVVVAGARLRSRLDGGRRN